MATTLICDEELARRLPLPLAQLYRRAHNAKNPLDRHQSAYYLWEASLKLLGSIAIASYAEHAAHNAAVDERLMLLARPSLGHWWEFVRTLVPILAEAGDPGFTAVRDWLAGPNRADLPRSAGLAAALDEVIDGRASARSTVRITELFNHLVQYRNREIGHGASGQRPASFYDHLGSAILAALTELLDRFNVLADRRLIFVAEVRRQKSGQWLVELYELAGESARRIEPLELTEDRAESLPRPELVYAIDANQALASLHPLILYNLETSEVSFLTAKRGQARAEYLCYSTGSVLPHQKLDVEQRALLARVLKIGVDDSETERWSAQSQAEEPSIPMAEEPAQAVRRLGDYELLSELGRGGMGVVYRAWQPSLGRQVALKCLLRPGDAKAEARFTREIHALGKAEHPNLVKVFTSGAQAEHWFYAMELVEGATLAAVCDTLTARSTSAWTIDLETWHDSVSAAHERSRQEEKPLSAPKPGEASTGAIHALRPPPPPRQSYVEHIVELVRQTAEAAHALHEAGVVHRDIKPGNILVTADGGQAVLMDLGLAQIADETEGRLTRTRQFVGTLRYASPEQVLAVAPVDRRSDVYSLGATLWELLTLRPLFGATEQTPTPELMQRIQHEEPERPRKYHPGLAVDLEAIVLKCLEKNPARRYATAAELAADLDRWLKGEPVQAQPPTFFYVAGKSAKKHRVALATVAALLLVGLAGTIFAFYTIHHERDRALAAEQKALDEKHVADGQRGRALAAEKTAQDEARLAREQSRKALMLSDFLVQLFRSSDPVGLEGLGFREPSESVKNLTAVQLLQRGADQLKHLTENAQNDPATTSVLVDAIGNSLRSLGDMEHAKPLLEEALKVRKKLPDVSDADLAESFFHLGILDHDLQELKPAETYYREAIKLYEKSDVKDTLAVSRVKFRLGWLLAESRRTAEAEGLFRDVLKTCQQKLGPNDPAVQTARLALLLIMLDRGDQTAWLIQVPTLLAGNSALIKGMVRYTQAMRERRARNYPAATRLYEEVLTNVRELLPPQHPILALLLGDMAGFYREAGDLRRAEALIREAVEIGRKTIPLHPAMIDALVAYADEMVRQDRIDDAERLYVEAIDTARRRRQVSPGDERWRQIVDKLVRMEEEKGRAEKAKTYRKLYEG